MKINITTFRQLSLECWLYSLPAFSFPVCLKLSPFLPWTWDFCMSVWLAPHPTVAILWLALSPTWQWPFCSCAHQLYQNSKGIDRLKKVGDICSRVIRGKKESFLYRLSRVARSPGRAGISWFQMLFSTPTPIISAGREEPGNKHDLPMSPRSEIGKLMMGGGGSTLWFWGKI